MRTSLYALRRAGCCLLVLLLLYLASVPTPAAAEGRTEADVRAAVETWVRHVTAEARPEAVVERMEPYRVEGETVAYIAHLQGGGFCLAGADDLVLPVYLYSPHGAYDPQNPGYRYVLWEIGARLEGLRKGLAERDPQLEPYLQALSERAAFWQALIAGRAPAQPEGDESILAEPTMMTLGLTSLWHQEPPYNNVCPMGDGGRTIAGCVATAAVQIMRYWNWPPSGVSNHSYIWDGDNSCGGLVGGGLLAATFSDAYDWPNMPDHCVDGCSPAQEAALSELSYEMGVALHMDYGACSSGADPSRVAIALESFFLYDPDTIFADRNIDVMVEEIQWLRPFHFRGTEPGGGGHSWAVLGYNKGTDPDREFLMNLGWGDPAAWYVYDSVVGGFNIDQKHTTWIAPLDAVKFVGSAVSGDGSPGQPYKNIEEAVAHAPNYSTLIFKAGSHNLFIDSPLVIDRPMTLKGYDVVIRLPVVAMGEQPGGLAGLVLWSGQQTGRWAAKAR